MARGVAVLDRLPGHHLYILASIGFLDSGTIL